MRSLVRGGPFVTRSASHPDLAASLDAEHSTNAASHLGFPAVVRDRDTTSLATNATAHRPRHTLTGTRHT